MAGVMRWVHTLSWPGLSDFHTAERQTLVNPDTQLTEAYVKAYYRLKFYWILGAGHSVGGLCMGLLPSQEFVLEGELLRANIRGRNPTVDGGSRGTAKGLREAPPAEF